MELTKEAKDTLTKDLQPYVRTSGDIYGLQEIVAELAKRPKIVKRHMRLWLNSTGVLQSLLTKEIGLRSSTLTADLEDALRTYVPNDSFNHAQEILETNHVVIISGIPGIGKTTLAQVLAADYLSQGFELVEISEDVEEANRSWDEDSPQIFYYDDFLGQTTLADKLHKNEDSRLLQLLRRIEKAPDKRLLLTTREYILNQARQRYEKIWHADFDPLKFILDLGSYTTKIRAQILYNHIYFSRLPQPNKAIFARLGAYWPIVDHPNFNPRLISASLESPVDDETPQQTATRVYENVQHPRRIWKHLVENQLDSSAVFLLELLFSFGNDTPLNAVQNAYRISDPIPAGGSNFHQALKILDGSLVRTTRRGDTLLISFHNPSVRDYMREFMSDRPERLRRLINQAIYFEQIDIIWRVGTGFEGSLIKSTLLSMSDELETALVRTIDSHNIYGYLVGYSAAKVNLLLQISEATRSAMLQTYLFDDVLPNVDLSDRESDDEDITSLVKELYKSTLPQAHDWLDNIVGQALDYATEDLSDWDNAAHAEFLIDELAEIGIDDPEILRRISEARSYVNDEKFEIASWYFEAQPEGSIGPTHAAQEMVEFARQFSNSHEIFPALDAVEDQLTQSQLGKAEVTRQIAPGFNEEGISIQDIFSSLAEE